MTYTKSALSHSLFSGGAPRSRTTSLSALLRQKGVFMSKVIALFIAQLCLTYAIFHYLGDNETFIHFAKNNNILFIVMCFVAPLLIIIVMAFVPMPIPIKLVLFTVFSTLIGASLAYIKRLVSPNIIKTAVIGSIAIFVTLFGVGVALVMMGANIAWLGIPLLIALFGLIITSIVFLLIDASDTAMRIKASIALFIFAVFVMYDTNQILQRDYSGDFVTASVDYYLDIVNIFVNILQLALHSE